MNVYTVTFFDGNYGSILQAYALQSRLREYGAAPYILSKRKHKRKLPRIFSIWRVFKSEKNYSFFQRLQRFLQRDDFEEKRLKLSIFVRENLSVKEITDKEKFIQSLSSKDIFLAGSDQIWNVLNKPLSNWYSLQWINNQYKKYSYAASIGLTSLTQKQIQDYAIGLADFRTISLREAHAIKAFSTLFPNKIRQDLDPTLLYDAVFWQKIESPRQIKEPYIFVYMLRPDNKLIDIARTIAKEKKCKVVFTGTYSYKYEGVQTICDAGVEDFLSYIDNAEAIVTNSFHGTVFSILYEKPFVSVKIASTGSRAESLLRLLHLDSQLIESTQQEFSIDVDYSNTQKILIDERKKSLEYLQSICNS